MSQISSILGARTTFSYEFFPPKNTLQATTLEATIGELAITDPDFISVTYGALGNTRATTKDIAISNNARWDFPTMAHLTCIAQKRTELTDLVDEYAEADLENILALRGDGDRPGDFAYAIDLASFIKARYPQMSVGVAAHPEIHPLSKNRKEDRERLAAKMEVADFAITQFFFDATHYHRLVEELDRLGNTKPIIPGIMLFLSAAGLKNMTDLNNTSLPGELTAKLDKLENPDDISKLAVDTAAELIEDLSEYDVPGLHIYTLNKSQPAISLKQLLES